MDELEKPENLETYLDGIEDNFEEEEEEEEEEEDPWLYEDLAHKNTSSFKCLAQTEISRSSLLRDPFFLFPEIEDLNLEEALWSEDPLPIYDDIGVQRYKDLCKKEGIICYRRVVQSLDKEVLDLKYYALNEKTMKTICETLQHNNHVEKLILQENFFTPEACAHLSPLLEKNEKILVLDLKQCQLGPFGIEKLGYSLALSKNLTELDLSYNNLGDEGIEHLAPSLRDNVSIKILNLSHNSLGDRALFALGPVLDNNYMINDLDLSWNYLYTPDGMRELMGSLADNIGVKHLNLSWNGIGDAITFHEIMTYLRNDNAKLQHLNLSNNRITGILPRMLRKGLKENETLVSLNLSFNPLTADEVKYISGTFLDTKDGSPALKFIDFGDTFCKKNFISTRRHIREKGCDVKVGGIFSNYRIKGPNVKEMLLHRAKYLASHQKKKKHRKDFGGFVILLQEEPVRREAFYEMVKKEKIKLDQDLLEMMAVTFLAEKKRVDLKQMKEVYLSLYPDTVPAPPKKPKRKKKKKK